MIPSQNFSKPPMFEVLKTLEGEIFKGLRCMMPATVTAVHTSPATVDVQVAAKMTTPQGKIVDYPPLVKVPLIVVQGGGVAFSAPVKVGDQCLVFFADRCMDAWKQTGSPQPLPQFRMHDLSDGFALVGVNMPQALTLLLTATEGGVSSDKAKVAVDSLLGKVTIANQTQNFFTLLTNLSTGLLALTTALEALQVNTSTGIVTPATVAAIVAAQTQLTAVQTGLAALFY